MLTCFLPQRQEEIRSKDDDLHWGMWRTPAHTPNDAQDRFLKGDYQHMAARFIRHFYMAKGSSTPL